MSWDAFQREALQALGYRTYALAGASDALETIDPDSALGRALVRAARCGAERLPGVMSVQGLRADPATKRALWPQLRRLRSQPA